MKKIINFSIHLKKNIDVIFYFYYTLVQTFKLHIYIIMDILKFEIINWHSIHDILTYNH